MVGDYTTLEIWLIILGLGPWYGQVGGSIFKCCFVKYMTKLRVPFFIYKLIKSLL